MIYCLQELFHAHKVRPIPVYVDSPLATRLTEIGSRVVRPRVAE